MPAIEISTQQRKQVDALVQFVKSQLEVLNVEARFVLAIEMHRLFKPEYDELRRKAANENQ